MPAFGRRRYGLLRRPPPAACIVKTESAVTVCLECGIDTVAEVSSVVVHHDITASVMCAFTETETQDIQGALPIAWRTEEGRDPCQHVLHNLDTISHPHRG